MYLGHVLSDGWVEKTVLQQKRWWWVGLCSKVVSAVKFSEKTYFFGKCLFSPWNVQCDQFLTSPRRLYCPCGDFHQNIFIKLVQDTFLLFAKDTHNDNFKNSWKNYAMLTFTSLIKKMEMHAPRLKKTFGVMFLYFW